MPYKDHERQIAYMRRYTKARRGEIRRLIREAKDRPCRDCGRSYPTCVMQFDHVRGEKALAIGSATAKIKNVAALIEEFGKCEVVCANCHALREHDRNGGCHACGA